jgi:hypothetical protein
LTLDFAESLTIKYLRFEVVLIRPFVTGSGMLEKYKRKQAKNSTKGEALKLAIMFISQLNVPLDCMKGG